MILAKDIKKYDKKTRQIFLDSTDKLTQTIEWMYLELSECGRSVLVGDQIFDGLKEKLENAGYICVESEHVYLTVTEPEISFFGYVFRPSKKEEFKQKRLSVYIPEEPDVQIENKRNYELFIVTNKGSNQSIKLTDMTQKEIKSYVEEAYKIGAIYTGYGFISTAVIDSVVIKEM